jgi:hypothetical protein
VRKAAGAAAVRLALARVDAAQEVVCGVGRRAERRGSRAISGEKRVQGYRRLPNGSTRLAQRRGKRRAAILDLRREPASRAEDRAASLLAPDALGRSSRGAVGIAPSAGSRSRSRGGADSVFLLQLAAARASRARAVSRSTSSTGCAARKGSRTRASVRRSCADLDVELRGRAAQLDAAAPSLEARAREAR